MCVFSWLTAWFGGANLGRLRGHSLVMGTAHNELWWCKPLWTHLWIDHMFFFLCKEVENLVNLLLLYHGEESPELKRMLPNSGHLSLLQGRLGVQVVVDKHIIDDSLAAHRCHATKMAQHGQGPISIQRYVGRTRRRLLTDV